MSLLRQIQDAAIDADQPVASALRKARVLAARLDNEPLRQWVSHELNGYPEVADLPPYRALRPVPVLGIFAGPFGRQVNNMPIPPLAVDKDYRDGPLFNFAFTEPVAAYEELLQTPYDEKWDLRSPWPADALIVVRPRVLQAHECMSAWRALPRGEIVGLVEGVRNRLLEFVLELEREAPDAGEAPMSELPLSEDRITQIFGTTIYAETATVSDQSVHVRGTTGNIASGQGNRVRQGDVAINQSGTDLSGLLDVLRIAVKQLDGQLPPAQLDAAQELVEDLEDEAAAAQPMRQRMIRTLKGIAAIAGTAGQAGTAVVDAAQAIHRALSE
jgi:hypothetical protein